MGTSLADRAIVGLAQAMEGAAALSHDDVAGALEEATGYALTPGDRDAIAALAGAVSGVLDSSSLTSVEPAQLVALVAAIAALVERLGAINESAPRCVVGFLLERYVRQHHRVVAALLALLGVLDRTAAPPSVGTPAGEQSEADSGGVLGFHPERLAMLLDPAAWAEEVYRWRSGFDFESFAARLVALLRAWGFDPALLVNGASRIRVPVICRGTFLRDYGELGLAIEGVPARGADGPGLALALYNLGTLSGAFALGPLEVAVEGGLDALSGFVLELSPGRAPVARFGLDWEDSDAPATLALRLAPTGKAQTDWCRAAGFHLATSGGSLRIALGVDGDRPEIAVRLTVTLEVGVEPSDGFLAAVLGGPRSIELRELTFQWSSLRGFRFAGGSAALRATIPVGLRLGGLTIASVDLAVMTTAAHEIAIGAYPQLAVCIGPVAAVVDGFGAEVIVDPRSLISPSGRRPAQIVVVPPTLVALEIAAGPVTGGGFLLYDRAVGRYAGALHVELASFSLTAIGLLDTQDASGDALSTGYSLLVIICTEFSPIQIGFGFTLNGIGGLLGLHRRVDLEALRSGVRDGALAAVLFPPDPVGSAAQLVRTLTQLFPVASGRFLIAPMVKLGWASFLKLELGILIELPAPVRLALLGRMRIALPDDDHAVVLLNLDSVGVFELASGEVSVDATLYDSQIAGFPVTGDMALRARWKGRPAFALAAGGFHPAFPPPEGFPSLRRLALELASGDNPRLRVEAYLAVTSNTIQFGGRAELSFERGGIAIHGSLSVDALIRRDPFGIQIDVDAAVSVKRGGTSLCAVRFHGQLLGPTPWRITGIARFELLWMRCEVSCSATFGTALPPAPPEPVVLAHRLLAEVNDAANWTALPPPDEGVVSLTAFEASGQLRVHPCGRALTFRERLAPLGVALQIFDGVAIAGPSRFTIVQASISGIETRAEPVPELFALGRFFRLTDDEQLSSPAFESLPCGVALEVGLEGDPDYDRIAADDVEPEMAYELVTIRHRPTPQQVVDLSTPVRAGRRLAGAVLDIAVRERRYVVAARDADAAAHAAAPHSATRIEAHRRLRDLGAASRGFAIHEED